MPELPEVERYRGLAEATLGRTIRRVDVPDPHCLRAVSVSRLRATLVGASFGTARRIGKLLVLDGPSCTVGLHFGMTGSLVVDDHDSFERLSYSSSGLHERWVRLRISFEGDGWLLLHDPRRLARIEMDPDEGRLGPDARTVTTGQLLGALAVRGGSDGPALKARLLDQERLAGVGNLLADEILWRSSLSPHRPCGSLTVDEVRRLQRQIRGTIERQLVRGGSHLGDMTADRHADGGCARDGTPLRRDTIGGRTTWWCPAHQR